MNNISAEFNNGLIQMNFINGSMIIPDKYGGYVIASGCGSGKTTLIKDIIRKKFNKGILYVAATIDECNLMYQFCKELVAQVNDPAVLSINDILVVHSDHNSEGVDTKDWKENPEKLADKKILICTHYKLMYEYLPYFTRTTFNKKFIVRDDINYFEKAFSSSSDNEYEVRSLPREYVLIDELPTLTPIKFTTDPNIMKLLSHRVVEKELVQIPGTSATKSITKQIKYEIPDMTELREYYKSLPKNSLPIKYSGSELSSQMIDEIIIGIINKNFTSLLLADGKKDVRYCISNFIYDGMESKLFVFDGTGDITFGRSPEELSKEFVDGTHRFTLMTFPNDKPKYNSPIDLRMITDFPLKRRADGSFDKGTKELQLKLDKVVESLVKVINDNERTLIVTWMNLKSSGGTNNSSLINECINESASLTKYYESKILSLGITPDKFSFIHYQSGLDRATNQFMEYDSIVLLGEFHVPNYVVAEFNESFKCNCSSLRYQMYQVVQAICRTRIRLHKGLPIRVYFTDDWSTDLISAVSGYLRPDDPVSANEVDGLKKLKLLSVDKTDTELLSKIRPKWREDILSLIEVYPMIRDHIVSNSAELLKLDIDLTVLSELCPRKDRLRVRNYYPLIDYLYKLGISLNVVE